MMNKINSLLDGETRICKKCGKHFNDITSYRKNVCRPCWNEKQREISRARTSTLDGYLRALFNPIKNHEKRKKHECNIGVDYLKELYYRQEGKCAISGIPLQIGFNTNSPFTLSVDRIDNNLGYIKGNVHLICWSINLFKSSFKLEDVYYISQKIVENKSWQERWSYGTS